MISHRFSVIIPVYNAAQYVERAVHSALDQPETGEVILVEDGSSDNSLDVCRKIETTSEKIRLFTHAENQNKGAGASRNLGILKSRHPYIAFLDADDYYLTNRFSEALKILEENTGIDGVYGASIHSFQNDEIKTLYSKKHDPGTMALSATVDPKNLLDTLMGGQKGYFSIISLVVRKRIIDEIGLFDESLVQHQDTDFIWRLAKNGNLVSVSNETPLSVITVHCHNRIFKEKEARSYRQKLMYKWLKMSNRESFPLKRTNYIIRNFLANHWLVNALAPRLQPASKAVLLLVYAFKFPRSIVQVIFNRRHFPQ